MPRKVCEFPMGACLGSCIGSCAIGACCSLCGCSCLASDGLANLLYVTIIAGMAVLSVGLRYGDVDLNVGFAVGTQGASVCQGPNCQGFAYTICNDDSCKGYWAVYRAAFTLASFFFMLLLLTMCKCAFATRMHRGFWLPRWSRSSSSSSARSLHRTTCSRRSRGGRASWRRCSTLPVCHHDRLWIRDQCVPYREGRGERLLLPPSRHPAPRLACYAGLSRLSD